MSKTITPHTILWLDRENAKLFNLEEGKLSTKHLHAHDPNHHTHVINQDEKDSQRFYKTVHEHIKDKKDIVILGPGLAKKHFQTYLETHFPVFQKSVMAYVTVDHPTDHQIMQYFNAISLE